MPSFAVRRFDQAADLMAAAAAALVEHLARPLAVPHAVMLSGGQTPQPVYCALGLRPLVVDPRAYVLFSDDRLVPADSAESNYHTALPLLRAAQVPPARVFRVRTELSLEVAAARYDEDLRGFLAGGGRITLGFLGLGADGHTASLFTPADVRRGQGALAVAVPRPAGPHRVSVTPALLARVEQLVFLVAGADKQEAVERLVANPAAVTAGLAVADVKAVEIWTA